MIDERPRCGNPACGKPLAILPGHRRRQYCDDACKMAAHRARLAAANQARYEALQLELARQEREALRPRWGDLPPEALDLLRSLRLTYGIVLADQVAGVLSLVRDEARKSQAEEEVITFFRAVFPAKTLQSEHVNPNIILVNIQQLSW